MFKSLTQSYGVMGNYRPRIRNCRVEVKKVESEVLYQARFAAIHTRCEQRLHSDTRAYFSNNHFDN